MSPHTTTLRVAAALAVSASLSLAQAPRPLSTDRPDITESAYTVPRGFLQVELDAFSAGEARADGLLARSFSAATVNTKFGVSNRVDLQFVTPLFERSVEQPSVGSRQVRNGIGDLTVRAKINVYGNDGGATALAVMPFIKLPSASEGLGNGFIEGGLIVPFALSLPAGFGAGLMTEVDVLRREDAAAYGVHLVQSATVGRDLFGPVAAYVETVAETAPRHASGLRLLGNGGFTIGITDDVQFDGGANFGLSNGTERVRAFVGLSFRR